MISQIWFPVFLALGVASAPADPELHRRIVDGDPSEKFEFPWLGSIQSFSRHICGGTLINADTLVTAAHCSSVAISPFLRVLAHRHNLIVPRWMERSLKFSVESIAIHPQFNRTSLANDVAVWKLKLIRGDRDQVPFDLVELDDGHYTSPDTQYKIAGWGVTSPIAVTSSWRQREGEVAIVPRETCIASYPDLQPNTICAAGANGDRDDTCYGDSGGPLFIERGQGKVTLVGITSYGTGCGNAVFPGVYTQVSGVLDWIKTQI